MESKETVKKESEGRLKAKNLRRGREKHDILRSQKKFKALKETFKKVEILLPETVGHLERDAGSTAFITQNEIKSAVDITAATKSFSLNLNQFGPYQFRYSLDGRHVALGGRMGHLASFDWVTKKLKFEVNVTESIYDVCYLHQHDMLATAQKKWVHIYDAKGVELHCLRQMHMPISLEFLPYHFLLCSGSDNGYMHWLDVTMGKELLKTPTYKGRLNIMCQNPANAVIHTGHSNGVVLMWTPNSRKPVAEILCHPQPIASVTVDPYGRYMATSGNDKRIKIWDLRMMGTALACHQLRDVGRNLAFSQKGLLAASLNDRIEVYSNTTSAENASIYMRHQATGVHKLGFCAYEDVLGVSGYDGFSSLIIPGSGDPNFDALEVNPFASKQAKRESEVKSVLAKVPHSHIALDPATITEVDVPTAKEKYERTVAEGYVKVPKLNFTPRYRMKGKSKSVNRLKRKKTESEKNRANTFKTKKSKLNANNKPTKKTGILDRFEPKK